MCNRSRFASAGFSGEIIRQSDALGGGDESSLLGMAAVATGGILHRAKSEVSKLVMTTNEGALLTVQEVAAILKVPVSWVYEHTRGNCREKLPYVKVGKYLRFFDADIANYLRAIRARNGGSRSPA